MSLINQMLKDLDARKKEGGAPESVPGLSPTDSPQKSSHRLAIWLVIILILLVLGAAYFYWTYTQKKSSNRIRKLHVRHLVAKFASKKAEKPKHLKAAATVALAQISSVQMSQKKGQLALTITLDQPVHFQFGHRAALNMDVVTLKGHLPAVVNIPTINLKKSLLDAFSVVNVGKTVEVRIVPKPQVRLLYSGTDPNNNKQLLLKFAQKTTAKTAPAKPLKKKVVALTPEQKAAMVYRSALAKAQAGDLAAAQTALQWAVAQYPHYQPAKLALIRLFLQKHAFKSADALLVPALKANPTDPQLLTLKAHQLILMHKPQQALALLSEYSPSLKQNTDYYALLAALYQRTGNPREAIQLYQQLLAMDASRSVWWLGYAVALESLGETNRAVGSYKQALSTNQLSPTVTLFVQNKLRQLGGG